MGKQKIGYCKFLVVFLLFILLPGCQSEKAKVSGKIFFQGVPIETGKISFDSIDGNAQGSSGEIIEGKYELKNNQALGKGFMVVRIWGFKKTGKKIIPPFGAPGISSGGELMDEIQMYIPSEFNTSSKQIVDIKLGEDNVFDFEL
ncbi:MAG: hypothetical protein DWH70_04985 [Planctomycetota bacterium]|nr:MAG: hypothetical protein DWH70_04985 [Planctomycetota bacterium]